MESGLTRKETGGVRREPSIAHGMDRSSTRRMVPLPQPDDNNNSNAVPVVADAQAAPVSSAFEKLDLLGPTLLDVLTLKNPPKLKRNQEDFPPATFDDDANATGDQFSPETDQKNAKFDVSISRSVILGRLVDPSVDNSRKTQEWFAKMLESIKCDATGLVLLQDASVVVFLETTSDHFLAICKQLRTQTALFDAASMRILGSCDDNPARILQGLYFKKVVINRTSDGADRTDDSVRQHVVDAFLNLVKFMKKIGPMQPVSWLEKNCRVFLCV